MERPGYLNSLDCCHPGQVWRIDMPKWLLEYSYDCQGMITGRIRNSQPCNDYHIENNSIVKSELENSAGIAFRFFYRVRTFERDVTPASTWYGQNPGQQSSSILLLQPWASLECQISLVVFPSLFTYKLTIGAGPNEILPIWSSESVAKSSRGCGHRHICRIYPPPAW